MTSRSLRDRIRRSGPPRALSRKARWRRCILRRLLAAACLVAAALGLVRVLAPPPPPVQIVVAAASDLAAGHLIAEEDLDLVALPSPVPGPVVASIEGAVGRRLAIPAARGEALTTTRLVPRSVSEGLEDGSVALHVEVVDPQSLDLVAPGLRVSLHDLEGAEAVRSVLVLSVDERAPKSGFGFVADGSRAGLVVAIPRDEVPRLLTRAGPEARGPTVHLVLDPTSG